MRRSVAAYEKLIERHGFMVTSEDVLADEKTLEEKPGLRKAGRVPLALLMDCVKPTG